jgi:hypothetical protein
MSLSLNPNEQVVYVTLYLGDYRVYRSFDEAKERQAVSKKAQDKMMKSPSPNIKFASNIAGPIYEVSLGWQEI